jgi:hypothetical protein
MSTEISKQLLKTKYLIDHSIETEAFDQAVASLLSTEMYFRRSLHRLVEYIAWIIYWVICPENWQFECRFGSNTIKALA